MFGCRVKNPAQANTQSGSVKKMTRKLRLAMNTKMMTGSTANKTTSTSQPLRTEALISWVSIVRSFINLISILYHNARPGGLRGERLVA
jgi:hypothetical protein